MKEITSRDNPLYKELKLLASSSQARRKAGRTLLDGVHLCQTYLQQGHVPGLCVIADSVRNHPEVAAVIRQCETVHAQCIVLPASLYQALSQVENGVGLLFVIDVPSVTMPAVLSESVLLLDNLQDPGNLGSILRSTAAAGIRYVFCSKGTALAWSPKVLRAGMGAHFALQILENVDLPALLNTLRIPVLATSSHASRSVYEMDLTQPVAWLFGHEGQGVSPDLMALATEKVAIPHLGRMESLNVAASAAICLFEQVRQKTCHLA